MEWKSKKTGREVERECSSVVIVLFFNLFVLERENRLNEKWSENDE